MKSTAFRDSQLDRDVAIKILFASAFYDERARKRFRNEAVPLAKLNHPYIASIQEFGAEKGIDYIVMKRVSAKSRFDACSAICRA